MAPYYPTPALLLQDAAIPLGYLFVGCALKYIDEAYDTGAHDRQSALFLAIPAAAVVGLLMVFDQPSTAIFLALLLSSAAAKKVDNAAFKVGLVISIAIPAIFASGITILWGLFGILFAAALADEYGNDWVDRARKAPRSLRHGQSRLLWAPEAFFRGRLTLPLAAAILTLAGALEARYFAALLLLDLGYHLTGRLSHFSRPQRLQRPHGNRHKHQILM
jgi:hypothetical protein